MTIGAMELASKGLLSSILSAIPSSIGKRIRLHSLMAIIDLGDLGDCDCESAEACAAMDIAHAPDTRRATTRQEDSDNAMMRKSSVDSGTKVLATISFAETTGTEETGADDSQMYQDAVCI